MKHPLSKPNPRLSWASLEADGALSIKPTRGQIIPLSQGLFVHWLSGVQVIGTPSDQPRTILDAILKPGI